MGKGNAAVTQWIGRNDRYADLFNAYVFDGEEVVLPEELEPADGESDILLVDKDNNVQEVHRYRDIIMRWKKGAYLVLLACENQEKVHYAMTVRNMLYDSLSYVGQIQQKWNMNQSKKEKSRDVKKMSGAEYLSKYRKEDKLIPVITLVFYYDVKKWDVESLDRFHTDLQEILGMLQCRGDKNRLMEYINTKADFFRNVDGETYQFICTMLHSKKLLKGKVEKGKGEARVDMCKALEDLYNDGIEQGMVEAFQEIGMEKDEVIERIMKKFEISREQAKECVEQYWKN